MPIKSIRLRTTLLYSGTLLAILLAYNIILFFSVRATLIKDIDDQLTVKASEISNVFKAYEKIKTISSQPMLTLENLLRARGVLPKQEVVIDDLWRSEFETLKLKQDYINILTVSGHTLIHSINVTPKMQRIITKQFGYSHNRMFFGNLETKSADLRAVNMPFTYKKNLPLIIQVFTPLNPTNRFLTKLMLVSSFCVIAIILLTSFLGSFFVKRILIPVVTLTQTANNISHMDLSTRIPEQYTDVELSQLIDSFNAMLERLEKSFIHINEFNSYVAHELKTPLAIVKGELELALEQSKDDEEGQKVLSDCLEETDRMIQITKDLLLLTKLDYSPQIMKFEKINLKDFFEEMCEHGIILASEKEIELTSEYAPKEELSVRGDKVHLRRLFLNIITNAIKYSPAHTGKIHLSAKRLKDHIHIEISDNGEGISQENLNKVFDKFFRVDKGERVSEAGFGLGLSIALSIANAHQGDIEIKSKLAEGTTFTVILPLADS